MNKKIVLASVGTIIALAVGISIVQSIQVSEKYSDVFTVDATYYPERKLVEVRFDDNSKKTESVILEVLGLQPSFQKIFDSSSFVTTIPFDSEPQYGWKVTPVTFVVEHTEYGKIGIKIDIHNEGEPSGNAIFTEL